MYSIKLIPLFFFISLAWAEDYYALLGVDKTADQRDIRKAFKKLAITEHPDKKTDDPEAHANFVKLTTAYEVLKDPDSRKEYDLYGEEGLDASKRSSGSYHSYYYYQHNFGIYDDDPQIVTLNKHDYFESVQDSKRMWFVNFYSPQCSHCHHLAPEWRKVAKDLEGVIRIGAVNCEDDWYLCSQVGIKSYPTLLYYAPNSKQGTKYVGEKSYNAIVRFALDKLDVDLREISKSVWHLLLSGKDKIEKPTLIFVCGGNRYCFNADERLRIAATFDGIVDVRIYNCNSDNCGKLPKAAGIVFLPPSSDPKDFKPVFFEDIFEVQDLVKTILEQLPEPQDISEDAFNDILDQLSKKSTDEWLLCFYIGHATEFDILLKQLPSVLKDVNLAKINCGRYSTLCKNLHINHYPAWGVLKPGGAFELSHGKNKMNDIVNFAKNSLKAKNVFALSAQQVHSILKGETDEAWFLDWYAPWCPPCIQFLPEVRKASLQFDSSVIHFGTVDCTIHSGICSEYNVRSYPTAMLVNGSNTVYFKNNKRTARHIVDFINEVMTPTVMHLTSENFNRRLGKKRGKHLWVVDYFAPWCGPCQQLAPEWTEVAKMFKPLSFVKIASIDCEVEKMICEQQSVRSYPTIRLYPLGSEGLNSVALYNGQRDSLSMTKWILHFLPAKVQDLSYHNYQNTILKTDDAVLVDYFSPWCGHCVVLEPQFAVAAQLLEGKVKFVRVNCDNYRSICSEANIFSYPTLRLHWLQEHRTSLESGVKLQSSTAETIKDEVLSLLKQRKQGHDEF